MNNKDNSTQVSKDGFEHYMLKEIYEQPKVVKNILENREEIYNSNFSKEELEQIDKIYIVACGTALHAGQNGKFALEMLTGIPVITDIASEFRYNDVFIDEKTLLIVISQSGETADTIGALEKGIRYKAKTLSITNVMDSTIANMTEKSMFCNAGPEISIASTKAYMAQLTVLFLLSLDIALKLKAIDTQTFDKVLASLKEIPEKINIVLKDLTAYKEIAKELKEVNSMFYIGRGSDFITAKEGSLKLKETSYIHSEPFPAGELKHGTMAIIDETSKIIAVAAQSGLDAKTTVNVSELKDKGAKVFSIGTEENEVLKNNSDITILIPKTIDLLVPMLAVVPEQLIAYYTALAKGNDVDHPRNLTKSVISE
ncbi:isomerizing glutamine--fructose-6-phosphate transaminase [Anaerosphaera multitolerans]|uniref:Glutamine--fructose-6-phosphate aminotransferase [isomerizing] n=1 Tax=Anaerosphaera multitolerans TaxID=2487351 RepID=A0A437S7Z8_9FIRM|nr:isomerizing glutamine--fructose-6-phosphate transaminase [Anaerosphaera multitolerans]RVU55196.1 isomerizing glutamine--fructose-6-phosphate transaminase [Anaerosphaera multitolerans]